MLLFVQPSARPVFLSSRIQLRIFRLKSKGRVMSVRRSVYSLGIMLRFCGFGKWSVVHISSEYFLS